MSRRDSSSSCIFHWHTIFSIKCIVSSQSPFPFSYLVLSLLVARNSIHISFSLLFFCVCSALAKKITLAKMFYIECVPRRSVWLLTSCVRFGRTSSVICFPLLSSVHTITSTHTQCKRELDISSLTSILSSSQSFGCHFLCASLKYLFSSLDSHCLSQQQQQRQQHLLNMYTYGLCRRQRQRRNA